MRMTNKNIRALNIFLSIKRIFYNWIYFFVKTQDEGTIAFRRVGVYASKISNDIKKMNNHIIL